MKKTLLIIGIIIVVSIIIVSVVLITNPGLRAMKGSTEPPSIPSMDQNAAINANLKTYNNPAYKFSIQYPSDRWVDDGKSRENGIYLNLKERTTNFYPNHVTLTFTGNDIECSRFADYKNPDGETLIVNGLTFQHVSKKVIEPMNQLIDNYEVFDKYFYTKGSICYSARLHTSTSLSKLDKTDPSGNKKLTESQLEALRVDMDKEVEIIEADFRSILGTFQFI